MNKRKCGTCRFFQEAGLAGSGWCHHPQRRMTSDVMIMVRRGELACRDEWAHDLWLPLAGGEEGQDGGSAAAAANGRFEARREPAATADEIAAVVRMRVPSEPGGPDPVQEDVVLGEARVMAESERDWTWQREDAPAARVVDTRAAIIKARETYRDRLKTEAAQRPAERVGTVDTAAGAGAEPPVVGDPAAAVAPRVRQDPVPETNAAAFEADPAGEERSAAPPLELRRSTAPGPGRDRFDSVPDALPGFDLPRPRPVPLEPLVGAAGAERVPVDSDAAAPAANGRAARSFGGDEAAEPGPVRGRRPLAPRRRPFAAETERPAGLEGRSLERRPLRTDRLMPARSLSFRSAAPAEELAAEVDGERAPVESGDQPGGKGWEDDVPARAPSDRWSARRIEPPPVPAREVAARRAVGEGWQTADEVEAFAPEWGFEAEPEGEPAFAESAFPDPFAEAEPAAVGVARPAPAAPWPAVPVAEREEIADDLLDMRVAVAPTVPRMCRTCRDFRPAEGGERGWCTNEWAFTHRRMVDPADEAPCTTSLGSWWLPADEIWAGAIDVSSHGQPTPLFDALVAVQRMLGRPSEEEPLRQRRRS